MTSVCILIPGKLYRPVGGHKIIYQHANHLASNGFKVCITNNIFTPSQKSFAFEVLRIIHAIARFFFLRLRKRNTCRKWFDLDPSIQEKQVWNFQYRHMPKTDYYVATDATTSPFLEDYPIPSDNKYYFIQGFENWCMTEHQLFQTYHYHCHILVISQWLKRIMDREGVICRVIPNGYDPSEFYLTRPIKERNKFHISMLYHLDKRKNIGMGLEALALVYKMIPDIQVSMFGVYDKPQNLPHYISYFQCPDRTTHNSLNNNASIFIGTSDVEGWGLTVLEAMACGQAVACTDNDGYLEMASHETNALVSPIGDAKALAANIIELITNDEKRIRIANEGLQTASRFTIDNSNRLFTDCFTK